MPNTAAKPKPFGVSGPELILREELEKIGATVEATIWRPSQEWLPNQYAFRVTRKDGSQQTGVVPWDLSTFAKVLEVAKGV
jgi:hypothetical protein